MPPRLRQTRTQSTPNASGIAPYQPHPPPRRTSTRSLHLSITLLILAVILIYAQKQTSVVKSVWTQSYLDGERVLPARYAVCGESGGKGKVLRVPAEVDDGDEEDWEERAVGRTDCVVVEDGLVVDTGSTNKIRRKWITSQHVSKPEDAMKIIWLPAGHTMTPGFIDSHGHPLVYGHSQQLILRGCTTIEEVIKRTEAFVLANPPKDGQWVEGLGWDQNLWPDRQFPTFAEFEKSPILRGLSISLARVDFHVLWVSKAVLSQLGDIPDAEGGTVVRDTDGSPTGVFIDNAMNILNAVKPAWTDEDRERFLGIMLKDAMSKGLTGVGDAQGLVSDQPFWNRMAEEGKLSIRFYNMLSCEGEDFCAGKVQPYDAFDNHYTLRSVKLFADGALGSRGAALIDDYTDQPGWKGLLLKKEEVWKPLIKQWFDAGWQVNVHTIGDRAAKVALDAIEFSTSNKTALREARFRLEHAQIMRKEDIKRAAEIGVIGSVQPTHATSDMWYAQDRIGPKRIKGAYAWRSYLAHGGRLTLGSDFPVESIDPLKGFYAAVTRKDAEGNSPHGKKGWYAEEKLTRVEALRGMTVWGAYAQFAEDKIGSITEGKKFDAVVWDDDLLDVPEDEMLDVRVKAVIVDGKLVYGSL